MNQAEQKARTAPLEAAAKAIFSLQRQVSEQDKRIMALERQVTLLAKLVDDTDDCYADRIEKLEAAIRDAGEAIVNLGLGGIELDTRIIALEKQVARHAAEAIANLGDQRNRIEQLETCATLNAETIGHVDGLRRFAAEQVERIEKLETRAALNADKEQRLPVVANAAVINRMHNSIEKLEQRLNSVLREVAPWLA